MSRKKKTVNKRRTHKNSPPYCGYPDWAIKEVKEHMNRKNAILEKINPRKIKHKKNQEKW